MVVLNRGFFGPKSQRPPSHSRPVWRLQTSERERENSAIEEGDMGTSVLVSIYEQRIRCASCWACSFGTCMRRDSTKATTAEYLTQRCWTGKTRAGRAEIHQGGKPFLSGERAVRTWREDSRSALFPTRRSGT